MLWSRSILAPAPASQDGGSGSGASTNSSSSPTIYCWKKVLQNFTSQFTGAWFIHKKVQVLYFTPPVLYLNRLILFYIIVKHFVYFLSGAWAGELEPPLFFTAPAKKGGSVSTTLVDDGGIVTGTKDKGNDVDPD